MTTTTGPPGKSHQVDSGPRQQPPAPGDRLLNKFEVAAILGGNFKPETVVRRWRKWGLQAHRVGKQLRWWESDVYEWISNHPA